MDNTWEPWVGGQVHFSSCFNAVFSAVTSHLFILTLLLAWYILPFNRFFSDKKQRLSSSITILFNKKKHGLPFRTWFEM